MSTNEPQEEKIQCPCGRIIEQPSDYKLLFLKKELNEIDILCPNDTCYLRELGYIKFKVEDDNVKIESATFYPPFVTWNAARLGREKALKILREHLKTIVQKHIDWNKIKEDYKKRLAEKGE
ncbi:MAG: hypothetical protein DRN04_01585 [Thermoprotei archaeon]|nr:MAG: hypothetical protein DRN04_01585 [Thermoprotei archaeon]